MLTWAWERVDQNSIITTPAGPKSPWLFALYELQDPPFATRSSVLHPADTTNSSTSSSRVLCLCMTMLQHAWSHAWVCSTV